MAKQRKKSERLAVATDAVLLDVCSFVLEKEKNVESRIETKTVSDEVKRKKTADRGIRF